MTFPPEWLSPALSSSRGPSSSPARPRPRPADFDTARSSRFWPCLLFLLLTPLAAGAAPGAVRKHVTPPRKTPAPAPPDSVGLETELLRAFLPKEDLGVDRFLGAHPNADGRGVIVAILDTGVDLHQPGLLQTSTGERKILDVFDATDNGLCELPVVQSTADSVLVGLSGRALHLGAHRSDDGVYRLGLLHGARVFPDGLEDRLLADRKKQRDLAVATWADTAGLGLERRHGEAEDTTGPPDRGRTYRKIRRMEDQDFDDPGPVYDLIALHRKGAWVLVIDTRGDGLLSADPELRPYGESGDLALFPSPVNLSMALSAIAADGSTVSLFFDEGAHGTHVAGIIGAYYGPSDPLNGIAPGARILAVKIGNGHLGGSTSHNSMVKGLDWAVRHGAMVANASFGGTTWFENGKELTSQFFDEMVQNHGIFVSLSAGNEGPGLSTVGAPGTARRVLTMGAAISPLTMLASYGGLVGDLEKLSSGARPAARAEGIRLFPFSSRGPLANGSPGVDFVSPGAALSTLPTWTLTRNENWNGTSMAAPQGAGCLALLISGCMQENIPISPARMKRALRASAVPLQGVSWVEQGAGLIQVPEAFQALQALAKTFPVDTTPSSAETSLPGGAANAPSSSSLSGGAAPASSSSRPSGPDSAAADSAQVPVVGVPATRDPVTLWKVEVDNPTGVGEGYYERDLERDDPYWKTFVVAPDLPELGANALRNRFNRVVRLSSTVPWMLAPPEVAVPSSGVSIRVRIDPSKMEPGLNVGRIRMLDVATAGNRGITSKLNAPGSEAELLATVIRPLTSSPPDYRIETHLDLPPGERKAVFVKVPEGATRLSVRVKEEAAEPTNVYTLAATALSLLLPPEALRDVADVALRRDDEKTFYQRVEPGTTVEIAVFARWVNAGPGSVDLTLDFDGLTGPAGLGSTARLSGEQGTSARWGETPITIQAGRDGAVVPVRALLKSVDAEVTAEVSGRAEPLVLDWSLRPDSLYKRPLDGGQAPLIMLGRGWIQMRAGETVTVDLHEPPEFEDFLDDAFCRLFTPDGRVVDEVNLSNGPFNLEASKDGPSIGWYRAVISVFAEDRSLLENWSLFTPEVIHETSPGVLTLYPDPVSGEAMAPDSVSRVSLLQGERRPFYLRAQDLPEDTVYVGSLSFGEGSEKPDLLRIPLRIDSRPATPDADDLLRESVEQLEDPALRTLELPPGLEPPEQPATPGTAEADHKPAAAGSDASGAARGSSAAQGSAGANASGGPGGANRPDSLSVSEGAPSSTGVWSVEAVHADLSEALGDLDQAEGVLKEWKESDYQNSNDSWELLFVRVDLWLRHGIARDGRLTDEARDNVAHLLDRASDRLDAAKKDLDRARNDLVKNKESKSDIRTMKDLADRESFLRGVEGDIDFRRARLALARGDLDESSNDLARSGANDFGGEDPEAVQAALLDAENRPLEAVEPALNALDADPWNPAAARLAVKIELDLGWTDLAQEQLQTWLDRYPTETTAFFDLEQRCRMTKKAPEARPVILYP